MRIAVAFAIVIVLILSPAKGTVRNREWAQKIADVLMYMDDVIASFQKLSSETNFNNIEELTEILQDLPSKLTDINKLDLDAPELDRAVFRRLIDRPEKPIVSKTFQSKNLESNYGTRGLGFMLKTNKGFQAFRCVQMLYSPPQSFNGYKLPMQKLCVRVNEDMGRQSTLHDFSTDKVCTGVNTCSGNNNPHPYGDTSGTNVQEACTEDGKCDVGKALTMMGALLWYKVSAFTARSLCSNYIRQLDEATINAEHEDIRKMAHTITLYASTLHWADFFTEAVAKRAYSDLPAAMALVQEREKSIERTTSACTVLNAADMCTIGDIYKEYQSLVRLQKDHATPTKTRNLRHYANIDHAKMIQLKTDAIRHIELLGEIRSLDANLQTAVKGISKYFRGLAEYDQGIAEADVAFLSGKLRDFDARAVKLADEAEKQIKDTMKVTLTTATFQLVEETGLLTARIAENMNPLRVIFGGVAPGDIYEQIGEVAGALVQETRAIALAARFNEVWEDTLGLSKDFYDNAGQINKLQELVQAIKDNTDLDNINIDSARFIKEYADYTPKIARSRLAKNDALWAAYKSSTCDILFAAEGIAAAGVQAVAGGMLMCESLEGTLAELATLRENIFDFQFDLVDAIAQVVRGIVGKTLAESITVSNDLLDASKLMLGFFITQYRLQSQASLYCDKLQYRNGGQPITACSRFQNGFFSSHSLDQLVANNLDTMNYEVDQRFVYIPTRAQFPGDTGFINLPSLASGSSIIFRPPANRTWLEQYNWLDPSVTIAPFVESFKLYLPRKTYQTKTNREYSKTHITLKSIVGSFVGVSSDVAYYLPLDNVRYQTFYGEGYNPSRCVKEILNPYSLCGNLPGICDTTERKAARSMMPTILSTWKLEYSVHRGAVKLKWDAPSPATNLLFIAKVKLRYVPDRNNKRYVTAPQLDGLPTPGCCNTGNKYRPTWNRMICEPCPSLPKSPTDAVSNLGGYYCEKGDEPVAREPPDQVNSSE